MDSTINLEISDKPATSAAAERYSEAVVPLSIPRIPEDLFPITSQEDLVAKLTGTHSSRSVPPPSASDALPAGEPPPGANDVPGES